MLLGHGEERGVGDGLGWFDFVGRAELVTALGVGVFAVDANVELRGIGAEGNAGEGLAVDLVAIGERGGGFAEARGDGMECGFEFVGVAGAGAHSGGDDELAAVGVDGGLGVISLGVAQAFAFAYEAGVGVGKVDLRVGCGGGCGWLGLWGPLVLPVRVSRAASLRSYSARSAAVRTSALCSRCGQAASFLRRRFSRRTISAGSFCGFSS